MKTACSLLYGFVLIFLIDVMPAQAAEQTKKNWMRIVDTSSSRTPQGLDARLASCGERDPSYRSEVERITKQHLSDADHKEVMARYDRSYERNLRKARKAAARDYEYQCGEKAIEIARNFTGSKNLLAGQLGHKNFLHLVATVNERDATKEAKNRASEEKSRKLAAVTPDSLQPRQGASHMTFWQANCSLNDTISPIIDRFNGDFEVSGHEIAEAYVEKYRIANWPEAYEQAWPFMLQYPKEPEKGIAAYLESLPGEERAQWDQNSREVFAEKVTDTLNIYRSIELFESFNPPPHQLAFLSSVNWSGKYFTRQEYVQRTLQYASEYQQQNPDVSPYVAGLWAINKFNVIDRRQKRGLDPDPRALRQLTDLHLWDIGFRKKMLEATDPELFNTKNEFGNELLHSYWTDRVDVYACLKNHKLNYHALASLSTDEVEALALKKNGQWCGPAVTVHARADNPDFFLGGGLKQLSSKLAAEVEKQCSGVQQISLVGYVEDGEAEVMNNRGTKSSGWHGLGRGPGPAQVVFLNRLREAFAGDLLAQRDVGMAFWDGLGTPKNERRAAHWLRQAAQNGQPLAQAEYAWNILRQRKTAYEDAKGWARKSMEQGDPVGMFMYGRLEAPWYSKDRFHQLIRDKDPMGPFIMTGFSWEAADDICDMEPYKSAARYNGYCTQIDLYLEIISNFGGGGGGSSGCDPDDVGFCDGYMNPAEAHVFVQATGGY